MAKASNSEKQPTLAAVNWLGYVRGGGGLQSVRRVHTQYARSMCTCRLHIHAPSHVARRACSSTHGHAAVRVACLGRLESAWLGLGL